MHRAGQDAVLDMREARQIGFQMRTAPLDAITVAFPELLYSGLFSIVALGILQALRREALEEIVHVLVVRSLALGLEATGKENLVDPILLVVNNAIFEKRRVDVETVIPCFASLAPRYIGVYIVIPRVDAPGMEIEHDLLHVAVD